MIRFLIPALNDNSGDLKVKLRWLLLLRVIIVSSFVAAATFFRLLRAEGEGGLFYALLIPTIGAYIISIVSVLLLPRLRSSRLFAHFQLNVDVLLITGIIWITGDIVSPFSFLYNLAVMNGAILLFYRGAFLTAVFSSLCYGGMLVAAHYFGGSSASYLSWPQLLPIMLNILSFFIIASLGGFLASQLDQTERLLKQKQIDYQKLEALKEALVQGVGSGVAITDAQGQINYFNTQAQQLTSLQDGVVKGKKLNHIFPGLSYHFDLPQEARRIVTNEIAFADSHGRNKQLRLTLAPLSNSLEELIGYVSIFEDITKQKEFEEKVRFEEAMRKAREVELGSNGDQTSDSEFHFEGVIGRSPGIEKIYQLIQKVAATNTNVLITGESGTGKELVARAIHFNGPRRDKPFVAVNCGAIPENLIESELFGHVRGAFTGAVSDHAGVFKQADEGTIFLDEVGELPLHLQVKLLRVLQEKTFTPVGGSKPVKVDVRVISASNKDLRKEMEQGRFREDLFFRLNVVQMVMPPLRNRRDDIPALAHYFLRRFGVAHAKRVEELSSGALMHLMSYSYPGNVRELENIIEHAVAVTSKNILAEDDLPGHVKGVPISEEVEVFEKTAPGGADLFFGKGLSLDDELATHEKCILLGALKRANGVQKRAAEILGINYRSLRHRLEKYGLLNSRHHGFTEEPAPEE
jgi:two-component system response regulator PilR (NtrC family)